jgi:A-macroglobulin TED domain/A-macroglobulin receptor binding domain
MFIKVTAKGSLAGDAVEKSVKIISQGIPMSVTDTVYIYTSKDNPTFSTANLFCKYPDGTYPDAKEVYATITGDNVGEFLQNIEKNILFDREVGSRALIYLSINLSVRKYLVAKNQLTPVLEQKILEIITTKYRDLIFSKLNDGGFTVSIFNPKSSTWITSMSIMALTWAKDVITIDSSLLKNGLNFIVSQQNSDGSFREPAESILKDIQLNSGPGIALTSYVAIVFVNAVKSNLQIQSALTKTINYLASKIESTNDVYELALLCYALNLNEHADRDNAWNKFYALAVNTDARYLFWERKDGLPANVELTSYGLLTMLLRNDVTDRDKIRAYKFILSKARGFIGGSVTQDTILGIYAMSVFIESYSLSNFTGTVNIKDNAGDSIDISLDSENLLNVQRFDLDANTDQLAISAFSSTSGFATVTLTCNFYKDSATIVNSFSISTRSSEYCGILSEFDNFICIGYIPPGRSNMVTVTITSPSGFIFRQPWHYYASRTISKVVIASDGTSATIYIDYIESAINTCFSAPMFLNNFAAEPVGGTIIVNDYHDSCKYLDTKCYLFRSICIFIYF